MFVSEDEKNSVASPLQLMLSNTTEYDVLFTLSVKRSGAYVTISSGDISSGKNNSVLLISRSEIERFASLKIELLFYSISTHDPRPPVSEFLRVNPVRFYKQNNFIQTPFVQKPAFAIPVIEFSDEYNWNHAEINPNHLAQAMKQKQAQPTITSKPHSIANPEFEIDLHIDELIENYTGMSKAQLLDVQITHCKRELEKAIDANAKKITFIHGVGTGRLKHEIYKLLQTYDRIQFYDAPYSKYGFGATEVLLR
ncbi:MAG: DUF2027 domain-containing protein [Bacteroidia bacterium]|nr:DUF2027 domain-containing protein [Bacteroidia bacterium]